MEAGSSTFVTQNAFASASGAPAWASAAAQVGPSPVLASSGAAAPASPAWPAAEPPARALPTRNAFAALAAAPAASAPSGAVAVMSPEGALPSSRPGSQGPTASTWVLPASALQQQPNVVRPEPNGGREGVAAAAAMAPAAPGLPVIALRARGARLPTLSQSGQDADASVIEGIERGRREREQRDSEQQGSRSDTLARQRAGKLQAVEDDTSALVCTRQDVAAALARTRIASGGTRQPWSATPAMFEVAEAPEDWEALVRCLLRSCEPLRRSRSRAGLVPALLLAQSALRVLALCGSDACAPRVRC